MGDRLGIPGAVDILSFLSTFAPVCTAYSLSSFLGNLQTPLLQQLNLKILLRTFCKSLPPHHSESVPVFPPWPHQDVFNFLLLFRIFFLFGGLKQKTNWPKTLQWHRPIGYGFSFSGRQIARKIYSAHPGRCCPADHGIHYYNVSIFIIIMFQLVWFCSLMLFAI